MSSPQVAKSLFQKGVVAPEDSPRRACFAAQQSQENTPMITSGIEKAQESACGTGWNKVRTAMTATTAITKPDATRHHAKRLEREDSFLKKFSTRAASSTLEINAADEQHQIGVIRRLLRLTHLHDFRLANACDFWSTIIQPKSWFMFYWLGVVTFAVLYNLWTTIARQAFPELVGDIVFVWIGFDSLFDFIYVLDIGVQLKTGCFEKGIMVRDAKKVALTYLRSKSFAIDMVSLLPLDLVQLWIGVHPLLRFPRFFKVYRCFDWNQMVENWTPYPNLWRVLNLSHVVCLGCHWFAAFYYLISKAEGFNSKWGYPEPKDEYATVTRKYLKSLYWSTLTLTTIGDLFPPESNFQHMFTIGTYLIGVFVFASIVGQVGNVINNRNQTRQEFETMLDNAKSYMRMHSVPSSLQRRVQRWYEYAWNRGKLNGGGDLYSALGMLPERLKTEIALHVNLETLKKVTIFQSCRPEFLHDLVLKMKTLICCEGDFVCRKGEVAREMFIIADGILEVISDAGEVVSKMSAGDFFGEIGILNLEGGVNRRTADVRSVGYSELFVLLRTDVLDALKDHPDAESVIREYGIRRLREMAARKAKPAGNGAPSVTASAAEGEQKTQSNASLAENSRSASVATLAASGETPVKGGDSVKNDCAPEKCEKTSTPESLNQVVAQLRMRKPFQAAQTSRMPFIDEDVGETAVDAEVARTQGNDATLDNLRDRKSSVAAALRQVAAMSAMPVLYGEKMKRHRNRMRTSNWSINESKFKKTTSGTDISAARQAKKDSLAFLTDDRIKELQCENERKQQLIDNMQQRILALQRIIVRNSQVFDQLLGSTVHANGIPQTDAGSSDGRLATTVQIQEDDEQNKSTAKLNS